MDDQPAKILVYDIRKGELVESDTVRLSDREWRQKLSAEAYQILRKHGTERAFTCELLKNREPGVYVCGGCGLDLFVIDKKFDSGTGWPSFNQPVHENNIGTSTDYNIGYARTEVHCARCEGHLGHVFKDGPPPTGLRYCINGAAMKFIPESEYKSE